MRIYTGQDVHLFVFRQGAGRFRSDRRGSFPAHGVTVRVRDPRGSGRWRHWRARLHLKGETQDGRGLMHFEIETWLTQGGIGYTRRLGTKSFLRLRAGRGRRGRP